MGAVQIISRSNDAFSNRDQAGQLLASHLKKFRGQNTVVLGIPRGGAIVAIKIAQELDMDFDVVLSHKLGAPDNPELAIGAICEDGTFFINSEIAAHTSADRNYIEMEKTRQLEKITARVEQYREILPKLDLSDKVAIITDDGIATGASMQAAAWAVRREMPRRIVLAIPVGPEDSVMDISKDADETICLRSPPYFAALSQFYSEFEQVEDSDLLEILEKYKHKRKEEMKTGKLKQAVVIAQKTGQVFIATADAMDMPHIACAGKIAIEGSDCLTVTEWFCPGTVANLDKNKNIAVAVWDKSSDTGFQMLGSLEKIQDMAILDGQPTAAQARRHLPQVERKLVIKVEKILDFKLGPHGDVEE